jgi:NADPH-dependent curcumin reductase CurA
LVDRSRLPVDARQLRSEQIMRGVKRGVASNVIKQQWTAAEIYPSSRLSVDMQVSTAAPDGIDVYFENVSGHVWNAVFPRLNPALMSAILRKSLTIRGFIQTEFAADLTGEFFERATPWVRDGSL